MTIAKIDERALYAMGWDRVTVEALRHILRQAGNELGAVTLPEGEIACPLCRLPPLRRPHLVTIPCEICGVGIELCECEL